MKIGYGKVGRSMPLTLAKCGNLGGDVEMVAVVKEMALRHPENQYYLIGRNSGETPEQAGLPDNVFNPWVQWAPELRRRLNAAHLNHGNLAVPEQLQAIEIFDDMTTQMMTRMDGYVLWVGQHGTTNSPIPSIQKPGTLTKPYDWSVYYAAFLLRGINAWRDVDPFNREEIYLNADARNRHKMRDLKWPLRHPVLTQFTFENNLKHERYGDECRPADVFRVNFDDNEPWSWDEVAEYEHSPFLWKSQVQNVYSRLEVNGLRPGTPFGDLISYDTRWDRRHRFGMFINEARATGIKPELARVNVVRDWVLPIEPDFLHGTWSSGSQESLGRIITPAPWSDYYPKLHSVLSTLTTPSSGSGWATAKPWEAFAAGTVCFFHPEYDTQNNILGDAPKELREWLRVKTPEELQVRVTHLSLPSGRPTWLWLIHEQKKHFDTALRELRYMKMIEERLGC